MTKFFLVLALLGLTACSSNFDKSLVSTNSNYAIINGTKVEENDPISKVTVGILNQTKDVDGKIMVSKCTGIIYNDNTILTAAHCIPVAPKGGSKTSILVFDTEINFNNLTKANARYVSKMVAHPDWVKAEEVKAAAAAAGAKPAPKAPAKKGPRVLPGFFDIGVMQFEGGIPNGYRAADFATAEVLGQIDQNLEVVFAGFGLVDDKPETNTDFLNRGHAKILGLNGKTEIITDQSDRNGVCQGDSGGPAFFVVNGKSYAWGIASRVLNPEDEKRPCSGFAIHGIIEANMKFVNTALKQFAQEQN